jgi:hypothetical protein
MEYDVGSNIKFTTIFLSFTSCFSSIPPFVLLFSPYPYIIFFRSLILPLHFILLFLPSSYFSSVIFFHHQTLTSIPLYHFIIFFHHRVSSPLGAPGADRSHRPRPHIRTRNRTWYVCTYALQHTDMCTYAMKCHIYVFKLNDDFLSQNNLIR